MKRYTGMGVFLLTLVLIIVVCYMVYSKLQIRETFAIKTNFTLEKSSGAPSQWWTNLQKEVMKKDPTTNAYKYPYAAGSMSCCSIKFSDSWLPSKFELYWSKPSLSQLGKTYMASVNIQSMAKNLDTEMKNISSSS